MNPKILSRINREEWLKMRQETGAMSTHERVKENRRGKGSYKRLKKFLTFDLSCYNTFITN